MSKTLTARFGAVDELSPALDRMANSGAKLCTKLDSVKNASTSLSQKVTQTGSSLAEASTATRELTENIGAYDDGIVDVMQTNDKFANTGSNVNTVLSESATATDELLEGLDELGGGAKRAADGIDVVGKESDKVRIKVDELGDEADETGDKIGSAFGSIGGLMASLGISAALKEIARGLIECSEAASTFETGMATVATIADTSNVSLEEMSAGVRKNAIEVATSSSDYAAAVYSAISASVDTAGAVDFVGDATKLAIGGFTSATTSVDVLTTAVNAYNLELEDASQISDYLVMTQNLGKTTVDELANSVGRVIPLASAYNVEMDNLSTTYATMTANGIATSEATTYIRGMLSELGNTGSEVSNILQDETGKSFAALMEQGYSLGDVLEILGESVNGNTTAFSNLWSSQEAGVGALSLYNTGADKFNSVLMEMRDSVGATDAAFNTMADTTAFAKQQMQVAADATKIAIGEAINPVLGLLYERIADVLGGISQYMTDHPKFVQNILGAATGVGVFTAAITALTAAKLMQEKATKLQTVAQTALNAVRSVDPVHAAIAAVTALAVAIGTALVLSIKEAEDGYYALTTESKRNYDQLQETTAEYERAVEVYGETSSEALSLKYQVDDLTKTYERGKQTVEEYYQSFSERINTLQENSQDRAETIELAEIEAGAIVYLTERLEDLISVRRRTSEEETEIANIVRQLNEAVPGLALNYDAYTHSLNQTVDAVNACTEAQSRMMLQQKIQEVADEAYSDRVTAEVELLKAKQNVAAAEEDLQKAMSTDGYQNYLTTISTLNTESEGYWLALASARFVYRDDVRAVEEAQSSLSTYQNSVVDAQSAIETANADLEMYQELMAENSELTFSSADATVDLGEATEEMQGVINDTADAIANLKTEYDAAYSTAVETVTGQFNLWDEVDNKVSETTASLTSSMQQQIEYWDKYSSNLDNLNNRDIDGLNEMLNEINDGSAEAAASLAAMAGASDTEVKAMVDKYNELKGKQTEAAESMAETATDFDTRIKEIQTSMKDSIDQMSLADEAKTAATNTINAYVDGIKKGETSAINAAQSIADKVATALGGIGITTTNAHDGSHALGLSYVPFDGYVSELHKGEAVLPANEADVWRSATITSEAADGKSVSRSESTVSSNKTITIDLVGSGAITVSGGAMSRIDIESVVREQLEPALVSILEQEIFEESDGSYEF